MTLAIDDDLAKCKVRRMFYALNTLQGFRLTTGSNVDMLTVDLSLALKTQEMKAAMLLSVAMQQMKRTGCICLSLMQSQN